MKYFHPNNQKTYRGFNDSMASGFKDRLDKFKSDTFFPDLSRGGDQKSLKDTFTSTWGQVKVINFDKMVDRKLVPEPIVRDKTKSDGFSLETNKLNTAKSAGWLNTNQGFSKDEQKEHRKTAVDFAKQTNRSNWLQPFKNQSTGLDYHISAKMLGSQGGALVPFEKIKPREQFADLNSSGVSPTKKKKYFHLGPLKSEAPISSLLDFRNMTGRDKDICVREGFTPLQVSPFY